MGQLVLKEKREQSVDTPIDCERSKKVLGSSNPTASGDIIISLSDKVL